MHYLVMLLNTACAIACFVCGICGLLYIPNINETFDIVKQIGYCILICVCAVLMFTIVNKVIYDFWNAD